MARRYVKRRSLAKRNKYSVEQTSFSLGVPKIVYDQRDDPSMQTHIAIVPPTEVQGMRKVKNFTVSFAGVGNDGSSLDLSFFYALVYVPQGYDPGILYTPVVNGARSLYTANQFVLSAGIIDLSAGPQRVFTKLARNLNSGDNIYLILKNTTTSANPLTVHGVVTYAITLQ